MTRFSILLAVIFTILVFGPSDDKTVHRQYVQYALAGSTDSGSDITLMRGEDEDKNGDKEDEAEKGGDKEKKEDSEGGWDRINDAPKLG